MWVGKGRCKTDDAQVHSQFDKQEKHVAEHQKFEPPAPAGCEERAESILASPPPAVLIQGNLEF